MNFEEKIIERLKRLEREVERLRVKERPVVGRPVFLATPLTSTSWDGDSFSTTGKTLIDLSTVFGVPAGVKAVDVLVNMRDSASATTYCYMFLSPNNTANSGKVFSCDNGKDDGLVPASAIVPCDANGDIYYQIVASGSGTMDVTIQIWGYWL